MKMLDSNVIKDRLSGDAADIAAASRKKIMLVLPNHHWVAIDDRYTMWIIWPTQLCLLAAQIEDKYNVRIVDCIIDDLSEKDFEEIVRKEKPDVVGISNFTNEYSKAGHKAADIVKSVDSSIITIMGGVYVIGTPELAMANKNVDYAIIGEAELLIKNFLDYIYGSKELPSKGFAYRKDGKAIIQQRADFIQDLDVLKYPAYHLIDFMKYATRYQRESTDRPRELPFARISVTRGCPVGCTFCQVESISGKHTRYRSAEHVIGEIEMLRNKYGVKFIMFDDDNLFVNKNKAKEILRLMITKNLNIKWLMMATAVFFMDDELVELCARSGCVYLNVAIESGSPRILKEILKKPIDLDQAKEMVKKIRSAGIELVANFIIGMPTERWDEIMQTIKLAEDINADYAKIFIWTPLPNTKLFSIAKNMGYLDDSFDFNKHSWTYGAFDTKEWRAKDLAVLRAYEWDRINFSASEKKKKIMEMMDVTEERLDEIRRLTREKANP